LLRLVQDAFSVQAAWVESPGEEMSEPTTLGEYVERCGEGSVLLRRILYGTDEPCPECGGSGREPNEPGTRYQCRTCHGTGRIKTPGMVERVKREVLAAAESDELPKSAGVAYGIVLAAEALRREIGEATR